MNWRGQPRRTTYRTVVGGVFAAAGLLIAGGLLWQQRLRPETVAVGVDEPLVNGAVIDPSDSNSADLFLERHPRSRIRLINHFNPPEQPPSVPAVNPSNFRNLQAETPVAPDWAAGCSAQSRDRRTTPWPRNRGSWHGAAHRRSRARGAHQPRPAPGLADLQP